MSRVTLTALAICGVSLVSDLAHAGWPLFARKQNPPVEVIYVKRKLPPKPPRKHKWCTHPPDAQIVQSIGALLTDQLGVPLDSRSLQLQVQRQLRDAPKADAKDAPKTGAKEAPKAGTSKEEVEQLKKDLEALKAELETLLRELKAVNK